LGGFVFVLLLGEEAHRMLLLLLLRQDTTHGMR